MGPGQLEAEMADNAWLTCEADTDIIFNTPINQMRTAVAGLIGYRSQHDGWPIGPSLTLSNSCPSGDYLSFDYGTVRIGIAVGNTLTGTAQPLGVVTNHSGTPEWDKIDKLVQEWQPAGLVVGVYRSRSTARHKTLPIMLAVFSND